MAVRDVNRIYQQRGIEFVRQLGTYLLQRFFRNNSDAFRRTGTSHVSFRALARHPDLDVSPTTLYRAVAIELQIRQLPIQFASCLSVSHHRILLTVPDVETRIGLAQVAASRRMSTREFEAYVRDHVARNRIPTRRGRPRLPAILKGIGQVNRAIARATAQHRGDVSLRPADRERARSMLRDLDARLAALSAMRDDLQRMLDAAAD